MAELDNVYSMTFDDVPDDINLPSGEYLFEVRKSKITKTEEDSPRVFVELTLRPVEVLSQDSEVSDDDLPNAYPVRDKVWVHTDGAKKFAKGVFEKILGQEVEGGVTLATLAEAVIGQTVRASVEQTVSEKNGNTYVNVKNYYKN